MKFMDLTGQRFGRLTVLERAARSSTKATYWLCQCDCGGVKSAFSGNLRNGTTTSCGCYRRQRITETKFKHGASRTPEWRTWRAMLRRCRVPTDAAYRHYGGRGITVSAAWAESFQAFFAYMGLRPTDKHSIDRIDVNGNYEPGNCRWATASEQARNRRPRHEWKRP